MDGGNVTILKGIHLGRGSIVSAGCVVTKSFPEYSIVDGVPAKPIKNRRMLNLILKNINNSYLDICDHEFITEDSIWPKLEHWLL